MAEMGAPKKQINWKQVDKMLFIQCTCVEIAGIMGVDQQTLVRRCKEDHEMTYEDYSHDKRQVGKMSLRRAQFKLAERNASMGIWLGKQVLDQQDKSISEITGKDGGPIQHTSFEFIPVGSDD